MLSRHPRALALAVLVPLSVLAAPPALAAGGFGNWDTNQPPPAATGAAGDGQASAGASTVVDVTTGGATTAGVPFSSTKRVVVPRRCWYGVGYSGQEYYDVWGPGGSAYTSPSANGYLAPSLHDGFEQYETETTGRWYEPRCAHHVPREEAGAYRAAHPAVYVLPGTPAPPEHEGLDPEFLAQVAFEHVEIPTGTIRWNPSLEGSAATLVNWETFVWVDDPVTEVQVTASVPGVSSTVTARLDTMTLEAPGAETRTCTGAGTPYTPGMTSSTCFIEFHRSSANQPVKDGHDLPTSTLTATATWAATWTSTLDPTTHELESQTLTTTAEIPVAEAQTLVTR